MTTQLRLIPAERHWKLDEETKRIGRQGLAQARAVLQQHDDSTTNSDHALAA